MDTGHLSNIGKRPVVRNLPAARIARSTAVTPKLRLVTNAPAITTMSNTRIASVVRLVPVVTDMGVSYADCVD